MTLPPTISMQSARRERPFVDVANTRFPRSGPRSPSPAVLPCSLADAHKRTPATVKRATSVDSSMHDTSLNLAVSEVQTLGTGTPTALPSPAKAPTAPAATAVVATGVAPVPSVSATPQPSPFKSGATLASTQAGASPSSSPAPELVTQGQSDMAPIVPRRISRATRSSARSSAVPFPTISEETFDMQCDPSPAPYFNYSSNTEVARGREWEKEVARRQENIKELRDRKIRLEQVHSTRPRKRSPSPSSAAASGQYRSPSYSYLTSLERKFTSDDIEFLATLHSSVVWRLWHVDLRPEVFASERMLATRLHLILIRYGKKDLPVPPIVALSKSHLVAHGNGNGNTTRNAFSTLGSGGVMGGFGKKASIEKEKKGIQSLEQLVAKSLLRKGEGNGKGVRGRRKVAVGFPVDDLEGYPTRGSVGGGKARREATSPLAKISW